MSPDRNAPCQISRKCGKKYGEVRRSTEKYGEEVRYAIDRDMDERYLEAVKNGDMEAAQKMVNDTTEKQDKKKGYFPSEEKYPFLQKNMFCIIFSLQRSFRYGQIFLPLPL